MIAMRTKGVTRRDSLKLATAASLVPALQTGTEEDRERRMKWWHEARFGMFIHWGLYSVLGRHEWVMENEAVPVAEYEQLAARFRPKPWPAREWAALAKKAGMKYMVMTTKHHEGFCLFDTSTTNYCAPKQAAGRDLVREFVEAARGEGLRVGFYYSLMDWHHPDGARCREDEAARRRFVDYIHTHVRELMSNYGKIDILWYDVPWPLTAEGWESLKMNQMVRKLQPDIVINNRSRVPEDFDTPEQRIEASKGRNWESCMTMNDSWGYHKADDNWKSARQCLRNLITCARLGGNYLLNIGPMPDGSVPPESVKILTEMGAWLSRNGAAIYTADPCTLTRSNYMSFTRKGNTLFAHVHYWPGSAAVIAGLRSKVLSAKLLATGAPVKFEQDEFRVRFTGLPEAAPDRPITTLAIECDGEPRQDTDYVRVNRPRRGV
jgi:alpha-L-fucosidase